MDASTIASIIRTGFTILSSIFMVVIFCVVKFNDIAHLDRQINDVDKKIDKLDDKYDEQGKEIGKLSSQISSIDGYIKGKQESNQFNKK